MGDAGTNSGCFWPFEEEKKLFDSKSPVFLSEPGTLVQTNQYTLNLPVTKG